MFALSADNTLLMKDLELVLEPVEIYGENGKIIGLYIPANLERCREIQARTMSQIDWKEIERRKQTETGGNTLGECLSGLEKLEEEMNRRKRMGETPLTTDEALHFYRRCLSAKPESTRLPPGNPGGQAQCVSP